MEYREFRYARQYRGKIKAVMLDWAGTTMDFGCMAPAVVFIKVYEKAGVPISMAEARLPMGAHKKVHIRKISEIPTVRERWIKVHGKAPTAADVDRMFADFVPHAGGVPVGVLDAHPGHAGGGGRMPPPRLQDRLHVRIPPGHARHQPGGREEAGLRPRLHVRRRRRSGRAPLPLHGPEEHDRDAGLARAGRGQGGRHADGHRGRAQRRLVVHRARDLRQRGGRAARASGTRCPRA